MAIRAAASKETTPEIELPLACKFAREEPSGFKRIMDVIEAPAGSDLDQLRWLTCQAEPLQQEVREAANEMVTTLGVAMNDGFNGGATATTLIAAHGDAPQLAYHFTKKTHASVVLDAAPAATKEIVLKPSGDPEYNPCFG